MSLLVNQELTPEIEDLGAWHDAKIGIAFDRLRELSRQYCRKFRVRLTHRLEGLHSDIEAPELLRGTGRGKQKHRHHAECANA
jgi:hypothetical protein